MIRNAWLTEVIAEDIRKYTRERGLGTHDRWVDISEWSVRRWVKDAPERVAEDRDSPRWREVSSHDLWRSWATYHLVDRQVDVRTRMSIGGWSDYSAIEPYLGEPMESRISEAMRSGSL